MLYNSISIYKVDILTLLPGSPQRTLVALADGFLFLADGTLILGGTVLSKNARKSSLKQVVMFLCLKVSNKGQNTCIMMKYDYKVKS